LLLEEYQKKDNRIAVITNEQNIGLTKSLNKGIKVARGKYIARMDADDISLPMRFEKQIEVMENNPNIIVCGSKIKVFGYKSRTYYLPIPEKSDDIKDLLIRRNCISHSTVIIRKEILIKNNILYNEEYIYAQDYKLWVDLCDFGNFYNIQAILLLYRTSRFQISKHTKNKQADCIIAARKDYVNKVLKNNNYNSAFDWDNITISVLKDIKKYYVPNKIVEVLYLSLKNYTIQEWFYFIFSFDFMQFSFRGNAVIVMRFLKLK
jgi:glycosyltransferase involved in cell wall biosynthesis